MPTLFNNIYYHLKPLIPRTAQIIIRRKIISIQRDKYKDTWPIDERAARPPKGWQGWPDGKKFALVLTHDVETEKGLDNCYNLIELEKSLGFRSSFNFVAEDYEVPSELRQHLVNEGFEVGLHGLSHDGKLYSSREEFKKQAQRINHYLKEWKSVGFRSPSMHYNLKWLHDLNVEYDASTFDTDPFEPLPQGMKTIFPFWVSENGTNKGYVELPYTLPQDFTLFILMKESNIDIWKEKLDWIAEKGGMVLLITHPDYMQDKGGNVNNEEYLIDYYKELLEYIKTKHIGQYWSVLPGDISKFWSLNYRTGAKELSVRRDIDDTSKKRSKRVSNRKIWIDLDNSPHVPFFRPIIDELEKNGYEITLTARDCFQVCELTDKFKLRYKTVGKHYGKYTIIKVMGILYRALQLAPTIIKEKPDMALSHGSRSLLILASILRIPSVLIEDYEHAKALINPTWVIAPEVIPDSAINIDNNHIFKYPGIKEDVYVPFFKPDPDIKKELCLNGKDVLITIRPPATEAHYRNPMSDELFNASIEFLSKNPDVCIILLPRNEKQKSQIKKEWEDLFSKRRIIIPDKVVDGLNLIWYSDLVISGGGTMNREAAALGVPVYSIFRGEIGAVDRYLSDSGRLILLETIDDVQTKIMLTKRNQTIKPLHHNNATLKSIAESVMKVVES